MLSCNNCSFKQTIPGDNHISCSRKFTFVDSPNPTGIKNGWFNFPVNFDPIWAEGCNGFFPSSFNPETVDISELLAAIAVERIRLKFLVDYNGDFPIINQETFDTYKKNIAKDKPIDTDRKDLTVALNMLLDKKI